ncbi:MAG: hypothetical protein OXS35_06715 [Dehalococcoidia bacterium]|nr:hypothetical protein [Dehalococcoidia bacterium]
MKLTAIETLLLAALLVLTAFVVRDGFLAFGLPESVWENRIEALVDRLFSLEALVVLALLVAAYWTLQALGHAPIAFWVVAALVALPHGVPLWGHNELPWYELAGVDAILVGDRVLLRDAAMLLTSLAGLVTLHRLMALRALDARLASQGVADEDRRRTLTFEALLLVGLVAAALSLALGAVLLATVLGRYNTGLADSTWTVGAVGGVAGALLALVLLLWRRASTTETPPSRGS